MSGVSGGSRDYGPRLGLRHWCNPERTSNSYSPSLRYRAGSRPSRQCSTRPPWRLAAVDAGRGSRRRHGAVASARGLSAQDAKALTGTATGGSGSGAIRRDKWASAVYWR